MPESPRKTGKFGTVYLDIYDASKGAVNRIRIADTFNWQLEETVRTEEATVKGEVSARYKVTGVSYTWTAERYVQAPAVFSREVQRYMLDPGPNLAAMGTAAGLDAGIEGNATLFGGAGLTAGSGTAPNKRPPVDFRLYILDAKAATSGGELVAAALPGSGTAFWEGSGFLIRGNLRTPRDGLINDTFEVQVDGDLTYTEAP